MVVGAVEAGYTMQSTHLGRLHGRRLGWNVGGWAYLWSNANMYSLACGKQKVKRRLYTSSAYMLFLKPKRSLRVS